MKSNRILLVSHSQMLGGAEKCLIELSQGLKNAGFFVIVVLPSKGDNFKLFCEVSNKVIVKSYPWWLNSQLKPSINYYFRRLLSQLKSIFFFINLLKELNPQIVINNTIVIPSSIIASKLLNIRNIWFIHELGDLDHQLKFDFTKKISFFIIKKFANNIIVNSEFLLNYYKNQLNRKDILLTNYSINKPEAIYFKENWNFSFYNLYLIGQVQEGKGQLDAIKAIKALNTKQISFKLYIIGQISSESYYNLLKEYIYENNIRNIEFIPHSSNPFLFVKENSIGLVCSRNEAFGRISIEYMKIGVPVIALNRPNNSNLITDKYNGLLYNEYEIDGLVNNILSIISDENLRRDIIRNARIFADKTFNIQNYLKPFLEIIEVKK